MGREWRDERNEKSEDIAQSKANERAKDTENNRLKKELKENIATGGTDGFANADLASAFGNGNKHNIHDADAANNKRNRGNKSEHARNDGKERAGRMKASFAGDKFETFITTFGS